MDFGYNSGISIFVCITEMGNLWRRIFFCMMQNNHLVVRILAGYYIFSYI